MLVDRYAFDATWEAFTSVKCSSWRDSLSMTLWLVNPLELSTSHDSGCFSFFGMEDNLLTEILGISLSFSLSFFLYTLTGMTAHSVGRSSLLRLEATSLLWYYYSRHLYFTKEYLRLSLLLSITLSSLSRLSLHTNCHFHRVRHFQVAVSNQVARMLLSLVASSLRTVSRNLL